MVRCAFTGCVKELAATQTKYCSRAHWRAAVDPHIPLRKCAFDGCNVMFMPITSQLVRGIGKYHSSACRYAATKKVPPERPCAGCGVLFTPNIKHQHSARYHSHACAMQSQQRGVVSLCARPGCEEPMLVTPGVTAAGRGKYHSRECANAGRTKWASVTRTCALPGCGVVFVIKEGRTADGRGHFHSRKCSYLAKKRGHERVCALAGCNERFSPPPSVVASGGGRYHSTGCAKADRQLHERFAFGDELFSYAELARLAGTTSGAIYQRLAKHGIQFGMEVPAALLRPARRGRRR